MKMRYALSFTLLLLATCSILHAQSMAGDESGATQQNYSSSCADPLMAPDEACNSSQQQDQQYQPQYSQQDQQQYPQQNQQQYSQQYPQSSQQQYPQSSQQQYPQQYQQTPGQPSITGPGMTFPRQLVGVDENAPLNAATRARLQQQGLLPEAPTEFQRFVEATTGQLLPVYGAELFRKVPSTFSPNNLAPVPLEYVIGPDDELRIRIWGQINYSGNVRVDRSGDIYLPQIGAVHVAGLQSSALDQHLREAVSRIYRNFDLSADVGRIRSIQVYVTGQARRPGAYTVSSLSSLVDALFASGGPSLQGSLRHVVVNRAGKTVSDFDLYALLIHGDKSHDIPLLPGDVLHIPPAGPQVAISGSIRNAAIYEVRDGETIGDLIEFAGKTSAMASNARISLERVEQHQLRKAMEFPFEANSLASPLADGDIVRIHPILPAYEKTVTLRGNVASPGRFTWKDGMHLSDLIPDRDSLQSRDYWWSRSRLGLPVPTFTPAPSVTTPNARETGSHGSVAAQIEAEPTTGVPGQANGVTGQAKRNRVYLAAPEINWDYAVIERLDPETLRTTLLPFDLGKLVLSHDASQDLALQPGDVVTIFSQADIRIPLEQQTKYVDLEGEFAHAGIYSVQPGETLRDLVRRAGGITPKAYLYGSQFTRESTRILQQQRLDEYIRTVSMEAERGTQALAMAGTSSSNSASDVAASRTAAQALVSRLSQVKATGRIVLQFHPESINMDEVPAISLENGDRFVIPPAPSTVNVIGAVYDQNSFLYQQGLTVTHYLHMAGGPNRNADSGHAFVIRADGSVVSHSGQKSSSLWTSNSFDKVRLTPGDTLVVPDKTLRPSGMRNFMEWTQVFSQLAFGAAAIHSF
jgi:polysaccharide biosynthesis/export protein